VRRGDPDLADRKIPGAKMEARSEEMGTAPREEDGNHAIYRRSILLTPCDYIMHSRCPLLDRPRFLRAAYFKIRQS